METRWLEAFVAVAEELHFGRAAARLHMAQSPLSQVVRKLERDLAMPLFDRNTRAVSLTSAGHALLPHAYEILDQLDLGRRAVHNTSQIYGRVSIGFTGAMNHLTVPPLTREVRRRYPGVALTLRDNLVSAHAIHLLQQGTLDLAFIGLPADPRKVRTRVVSRERLLAVLPSDHRLASREEIALADLSADEFIAMPLGGGSALSERVAQACLEAGFRPRIEQEVADPHIVSSLVGAGVGVSLLPESMQDGSAPGAVFVPLSGRPVILESALAWSPLNRSEALKSVLTVAKELLPTPAEPPERAKRS